jgi:hypothetical protein
MLWQPPPSWWLPSVFPMLRSMSSRVLYPMRPTQHCILHSLEWGPHQTLGVPLPLAVDPMGHPRQPRPGVLARGIQLSAELHMRLSCIVLVGGQWCMGATSSLFTGPLTTGWALCCTSFWGAAPFGPAGWGGLPSVPHCVGAAAPYNLLLIMAAPWQQSAFQCRGQPPNPVAIQRRLSSLLGGGGLQRFNTFQQLPRPLWWVPVRGPF